MQVDGPGGNPRPSTSYASALRGNDPERKRKKQETTKMDRETDEVSKGPKTVELQQEMRKLTAAIIEVLNREREKKKIAVGTYTELEAFCENMVYYDGPIGERKSNSHRKTDGV